jgi:hypothetical protein
MAATLVGLALFSMFQPVGSGKLSAKHFTGDTAYGGRGRIEGTVKEKGTPDVPVARQVWLIAEVTGTVIRETWSAPDGSYVFDYIDHRYKYTVVAFDHTGNYRAVIADNLAPVIP